MTYRYTTPPSPEMGTYSGMCRAGYYSTYRSDALADYNSARAHDGLEPLRRMPAGTRYTPLKPTSPPLQSLRHHVTGAIERGESIAIAAMEGAK